MTAWQGRLAAALAGLAAAAGQAPLSLWWLALPGFAGLIWLVGRGAQPGRLAWTAGAAMFAAALAWIVNPFLVDPARHGWMAPFALALMAGGLALFWGLAGRIAGRWPSGPQRSLAFAVALAGAEALRGVVFTGFPWALPGHIWMDTPIVQWVAVIGVNGLTLATLLTAALPAVAGGWSVPRWPSRPRAR